uniref:Agenet domain-containing protein n=1 Tax=Ananas comosus var. bracteatus TaxID=296719 RepID=A0A6V7QIM5_ANACO|nr:unnamed protein product [Ananas comosus var. bracteatus]
MLPIQRLISTDTSFADFVITQKIGCKILIRISITFDNFPINISYKLLLGRSHPKKKNKAKESEERLKRSRRKRDRGLIAAFLLKIVNFASFSGRRFSKLQFIMRFKKGNKIEVLNKTDVPSGSWRTAEIVSGNGHTYFVRYDQHYPQSGADVERVSRKDIRPCPPPVEGPIHWVSGDILEAFDNRSWKLAEVSSVVDRHYCFVRLLGYSRVFRTHFSNLRLRQLWQDDKWVVIRKDSIKRTGKDGNAMN